MAEKRYLVLARKWRPQRFEDVVGQEHITRTLKNAITSGRIHHAFLFIGSRGIGKTTTSRILAKALNCLSSDGPTPEPCDTCANCVSIGAGTNMDVIEIDAASNNGVDDVREIRENVRMVPSNGRYKVYIIDEVHQLSLPAFNALLKTLEEPPPHAKFILATTEAHKIPATIISRCQRYDFRRVPIAGIVTLLEKILETEKIRATPEALHAIARAAEGGIRDSESILDELITYCDGEITFQDVNDVLGLVNWNVLHDLCQAIIDRDVAAQLRIVEDVVAGGKDLSQFVQEILRYYRNLLVCKSSGALDLLHLPEEEIEHLQRRAENYGLTQLIRLVEQFAELNKDFDSQLAQRIALEALLIKLSKIGVELSIDTVLDKLLALAEGGLPAPAGAAPASAAPPRQAPPPRPTEAGPAKAPTVPAAPRRPAVTTDDIARAWPRIAAEAGNLSLKAAMWLDAATPLRVEGDTLVIGFAANAQRQRETLEKAEHRKLLEQALTAITANLLTFRTELTAPAPGTPGASNLVIDSALPYYPGVNPEEAREVLADPAVAHLLEVFKGKIADIRRPIAAVAAPADEA
jgi:DNA polymerase-3 subunit gamma/tau